MRNLLGLNYATPGLGLAVADASRPGQASHPALCTIDQECFYEPGQPPSGLYAAAAGTAGAGGMVSFLPAATPSFLDRALALARDLVRPFDLAAAAYQGNEAGSGVALTCRVNLSSGNLLLSFATPAVGPADPPVRFYYNSLSAAGAAGSFTSGLSEYGYGWGGLWRQWVDVLSSSSSSSSSGCGRVWLAKAINTSGQAWTVQRDGGGLVQTVTDPLGRATTFSYSGNLLSSVTDSGGRATTFGIDGNMNLTSVSSAGVATTTFAYDSNHLLTSVANPAGDVTTFAYDGCRRITTVTTPCQEVTTYGYPGGSQRLVTDAKGSTWTLTLDADHNVNIVQDPAGNTQTLSWEPYTQRLTAMQDGNGNTTTFTYQPMADYSRRLASVQRPAGTFSYLYDTSAGHLTAVSDENGHSASLTWDADGRRSGYSDYATSLGPNGNWSFAYTSLGQLTTATDPLGGTYTWSYDSSARQT